MVSHRSLLFGILALTLAAPAKASSPTTSELGADRGLRLDPADLSPYFQAPRLRAAKWAFDQGRYGDAFRRLGERPEAPLVRFLWALSALRSGRHALAAETFTALASEYPALADRCWMNAATAHTRLGQEAQAADLFARVPESSILFTQASIELGRTLERAGDLAGAAAAYERQLKIADLPGYRRIRALQALANLQRSLRDVDGERRTLLALYTQSTGSVAEQARARLGKLPPEAIAEHAEALIDAAKPQQAARLLRPVVAQHPVPSEAGCKARLALGKLHRRERQFSSAIEVLAPVIERCLIADVNARALFLVGFAQLSLGDGRALETFERLSKAHPEHALTDDALFFAARLHLQRREPEKARASLEQISARFPAGDFASDALFQTFWVSFRQAPGSADLAPLAVLERKAAADLDWTALARARYWKARAIEAKGERAAALDLYETVALEQPATLYGSLARAQVEVNDAGRAGALGRRLGFPTRTKTVWPLYAGSASEDPHLRAALELFRLGLPEVRVELGAVDATRHSGDANRLLFHLWTELKSPQMAQQIAVGAVQGSAGRLSAENGALFHLAYPRPFGNLIGAQADRAGVAPQLLEAIVRHESSFRPTARSGVGATGLTQLMPATAQSVASKLGMGALAPDSLVEPQLNLRLGAHYVAELDRRFDGNPALVLASYNAGPTQVTTWVDTHGPLPMDVFIEEIPFAETRQYVKHVLGTQGMYGLRRKASSSGVSARVARALDRRL